MDFDTGNSLGGGQSGDAAPGFARDLFGTGSRARPSGDSWWVRVFGGDGASRSQREQDAEVRARGAAYRIPGGSRKEVLVHLAVAVWRAGGYVPRDAFPQVRGHDLTPPDGEPKLVRALTRTSMGQIEHVLGQHLSGQRIVVEGHLAGSASTTVVIHPATPHRVVCSESAWPRLGALFAISTN